MHGLATGVRAVDRVPAACFEALAAPTALTGTAGTTCFTTTGEDGVLIASLAAQRRVRHPGVEHLAAHGTDTLVAAGVVATHSGMPFGHVGLGTGHFCVPYRFATHAAVLSVSSTHMVPPVPHGDVDHLDHVDYLARSPKGSKTPAKSQMVQIVQILHIII